MIGPEKSTLVNDLKYGYVHKATSKNRSSPSDRLTLLWPHQRIHSPDALLWL